MRPVTNRERVRVLNWVDKGEFHFRATEKLKRTGARWLVLDALVFEGLVRVMPTEKRFPRRIVVTTKGSHMTGVFDDIEAL